MLKVYLPVPTNLSQAMVRVATQLRSYAPTEVVELVTHSRYADLEVLHVIGQDALTYVSKAKHTAAIQYCLKTAGGDLTAWKRFWRRNKFVASYYDLSYLLHGVPFLHTPLGVDGDVFYPRNVLREDVVMTSGYVNGPGAEAIEAVWQAASEQAVSTLHLGPEPVGMETPRSRPFWSSVENVSDHDLARYYSSCSWVSGLRYVEGFELPALEGLACGARPILFDRHDMRQWYEGHAIFIPECQGEELVQVLQQVFMSDPDPVSEEERHEVLAYFDWTQIAHNFWLEVLR